MSNLGSRICVANPSLTELAPAPNSHFLSNFPTHAIGMTHTDYEPIEKWEKYYIQFIRGGNQIGSKQRCLNFRSNWVVQLKHEVIVAWGNWQELKPAVQVAGKIAVKWSPWPLVHGAIFCPIPGYVCMCVQYLARPEEGTKSLIARIKNGYEPLCGSWELNPSSL